MAFQVPNPSRLRDDPRLGSNDSYGNNGAFRLPSPEPGWELFIIASDGDAWEHVSVHARSLSTDRPRTPSWREMCFVKDQFWGPEDLVVQFHPRKADYVNLHEHTLHLWRPIDREIVSPPIELIGWR